jgi:hypothetical protein
VQQGCSTNSTKVNLELKFRDATKFATSRKQTRDDDSIDDNDVSLSTNHRNDSSHSTARQNDAIKFSTSRKRTRDEDLIDDSKVSLSTKRRNDISLLDTSLSPSRNRLKKPKTVPSEKDKSPIPISKPNPNSEKKKNSFGRNPDQFKNFSREELKSRGVLVQTRTYKKSKQLPIVGGEKVGMSFSTLLMLRPRLRLRPGVKTC